MLTFFPASLHEGESRPEVSAAGNGMQLPVPQRRVQLPLRLLQGAEGSTAAACRIFACHVVAGGAADTAPCFPRTWAFREGADTGASVLLIKSSMCLTNNNHECYLPVDVEVCRVPGMFFIVALLRDTTRGEPVRILRLHS